MRSYAAQLFEASLEGNEARAGVAGTVEIRDGALCFQGESPRDSSMRLPLVGLRCRSAGIERENLFFSSSVAPGVELMIERAIGSAIELQDIEDVARALGQRRQVRLRYFAVVGCGYLMVAIVLVGGLVIAGMVLEGPLRRLLSLF